MLRRAWSVVALGSVAAAAALGGSSVAPFDRGDLVEVFHEDGTMAWVHVDQPLAAHGAVPTSAEAARLASGQVTALHESGPSENRFDLVIVGDGYTADQLALFHEHARAKVAAISGIEPFTSYFGMFNVWMVDVVSNESGVDNDPYPGPDVDTALDMEFWCQGIERLLCVNQAKALAAAEAAPEVDHVLVLANSTKYGGAGGNVATSSGDNDASDLITIHELGHSIAGLADEYEYYARAGLSDDSTEDVTIPAPGLSGLPGQEPGGANITAASSPEELEENQLKWWRWLGEESPDGGTIGTYEGGGYTPIGIFRPSEDSLMHTLGIAKGGNLFNWVAYEAFVAAFHRSVFVVNDVSPRDDGRGARQFRIEVEQLGPLPFEIRWYVDGVEIERARGRTSFTLPASLSTGASQLRVDVVDPTPWVRDPELIAEDLTESLTWSL